MPIIAITVILIIRVMLHWLETRGADFKGVICHITKLTPHTRKIIMAWERFLAICMMVADVIWESARWDCLVAIETVGFFADLEITSC